jgi:hypothetical protein
MPALDPKDRPELIARRHPDWVEFERHYRWLGDTLEGGARYRDADYSGTLFEDHGVGLGIGGSGYVVGIGGVESTVGGLSKPNVDYRRRTKRNLIPHRSECEAGGQDSYEQRRERTPVPKVLERLVNRHLSRIYAREVRREAPDILANWWADVDGRGTEIGEWMRDVVGPMILAYGFADLCFDHPPAEDGEEPATRADVVRLGLDACVASVIRPENMAWYRLDRRGRYLECLVAERDDCGEVLWRHWTEVDSVLYRRVNANQIDEVSTTPHPYGRVPIVRAFDKRKLRCPHVGQPRYEAVAELQKAIYNGESERILGAIYTAHPKLLVPEKAVDESGNLNVSLDMALIMPSDKDGDPVPYQYLSAPTDGADEQRQLVQDFADAADREGALQKPAGASGTGAGTVAQSGISKVMDSQESHDLLSDESRVLARVERQAAEYALLVLHDGDIDACEADLAATTIDYPQDFDLTTAADSATALADVQSLAKDAGELPAVEAHAMKQVVRKSFRGLDAAAYAEMDADIDALVDRKRQQRDEYREAGLLGMQAAADSTVPPEDDPF